MTSLAQPHPDFSMRPTDKTIEVFDLDELFQQYETDIFPQLNSAAEDPSGPEDLAHLFEVPSSNGVDPFDTPPMPNWDPSSDDAWQRGLQLLEDNPASPAVQVKYSSVYQESGGKASLSDSGLYHLQNHFDLDRSERRPSASAPSTPKSIATRPSRVSTAQEQVQRHKIQQPAARKTSPLTKRMRPSTMHAGLQKHWASSMDTSADPFALPFSSSSDAPRTPPPSSKFSQGTSTNGLFSREQPYTVALSPPSVEATPETQHSNYQLTPLSSPAVDTNSRGNTLTDLFIFGNNTGSMNLQPPVHNAALSALHTPPPSTGLPMTTWGPNTPGTMDFAFSASPDFQSMTTMSGAWWNNGLTATTTQPATPTYNAHRRAYSQGQGMSFGNSGGVGLGISCDTAPFPSYDTSMGSSNTPMGTNLGGAPSMDMPYPHGPVYPSSPEGIPIGHGPARTPPSRSPTHSPIPQPRFTRRRHSSHLNHTSTSRAHKASSRKSSHSSSSHSNQKSVQGSFVNFTPDDSKKILTGVAPSGSSKTKARREKEVADKRRKLSQAAMKAIIEAGGDISRLEEGGLLSLEVE